MAKNKLSDLNDHLFAQLERLGDESLNKDQIEIEISRARAISMVAKEVTKAAKTLVDAKKTSELLIGSGIELPNTFE